MLFMLSMLAVCVEKTGISEYDKIDHKKGKVEFYFDSQGNTVSKKADSDYYRKSFGKQGNLYVVVDYSKDDKVVDIAKIKNLDEMFIENAGAEGLNVTFYENGKVFSVTNFQNGTLNGEQLIYYENGNKLAEKNYKNGKKDGEQKGYYTNGQLAGIWRYNSGTEDGKQSLYYNDGIEMVNVVYNNGKESYAKIYYKSRRILGEDENGVKRYYHESGKVMIDEHKGKYYDKNGKEITFEKFQTVYMKKIQSALKEGILNPELIEIGVIIEK